MIFDLTGSWPDVVGAPVLALLCFCSFSIVAFLAWSALHCWGQAVAVLGANCAGSLDSCTDGIRLALGGGTILGVLR